MGVSYQLLVDLVCGAVREAGAEDEDDLVLKLISPIEDVLEHAGQGHIRDGLADLLLELTSCGVGGALAELDMTPEGAVEGDSRGAEAL